MEPSLDKGKFLDSMSLSTPSLSCVRADAVARHCATGRKVTLLLGLLILQSVGGQLPATAPCQSSFALCLSRAGEKARKAERTVDPAALLPNPGSPEETKQSRC